MATLPIRGPVLAPVGALLALLVVSPPSHASCDPSTEPDKSDIGYARAMVEANCDCSEATIHGDYVRCAGEQANATLVNKSCMRAVRKCALHSTCGTRGLVTCCVTTTKGVTCKIRRDAAYCAANGGTVGSCTSRCDACAAPASGPSCAPRTTSTTTTTIMRGQ